MDKLHLKEQVGEHVRIGINGFPVLTGPEGNRESTVCHQVQICATTKSYGERERNSSQYHGFHERRYFSPRGQKSCIDTGLLNIIVQNTYTSSWLCFDHNRCLLGLGIYSQKAAHRHESQAKRGTFSRCLFICLSRARQPALSPGVSYPRQAG